MRGLKTRLEEAVHQNNKMTHAAELKDDKIQTLEKRFGYNYNQESYQIDVPPNNLRAPFPVAEFRRRY